MLLIYIDFKQFKEGPLVKWREENKDKLVITLKPTKKRKIVAIVTPDMGLFDDPTTPAIYAATAEKIKDINEKSTFELLFDSNHSIEERILKEQFIE